MAELLTTLQVQDLLKVDRTTIYRLIEGGTLPAIRVGKQWRFREPDVARWMVSHASTQSLESGVPAAPERKSPRGDGWVAGDLSDILPLAAAQLIQDGFAEALGVTIVTTDLRGVPITAISNACGFHTALMRDPRAMDKCAVVWRQLAASPSLEPRFFPNEMGLLCARGLIRAGAALKGMVVIGGIAPEPWPPAREALTTVAELFGLPTTYVDDHAQAVFRLDGPSQERALRAAQRVADIFSNLADARGEMVARLRDIASLTRL